jgi:hypothetical protein
MTVSLFNKHCFVNAAAFFLGGVAGALYAGPKSR